MARKGGVPGKGMSEKEGKAWGHGEFANMPKDVEVEQYPKGHKGYGKVLNDTMIGVDDWNDQMEGKRQRYVSDQH